MSLDFQQVRRQVHQLGEAAAAHQESLRECQEHADDLLARFATAFDEIQHKVDRAIAFDSTLRCARPLSEVVGKPEPLNTAINLPPMPAQATVIAADGSQIPLDRHESVEYCLINVGGIELVSGHPRAPVRRVSSRLMYDEAIVTTAGTPISEAGLALLRDKEERTMLADMAERATVFPVVTFTDGPIELWGARDPGAEATDYTKHLRDYLQALKRLERSGAVTAGYVDKPSANLVVRLLEIMVAEDRDLANMRRYHPLHGATDFTLFRRILQPGQRSAVFATQTQSARYYEDGLALHFFYMNVGRQDHSWLARIEIPAWVVMDPEKLAALQAVIMNQCQAMGSRPYPYLLHRAHETAVVSLEEREQVTQMITLELRRHGIEPGEQSQKQQHKNLPGRTGYTK